MRMCDVTVSAGGTGRVCRPGASLLVLLLMATVPAKADPADGLLGRWYTEGRRAIFDFYQADGELRARLTPLENPGLVDSLNPVDSLRSRKIAGETTIWGLVYNPKKKQWEKGRVYNPSDGKTYSCSCRLKNGNLIFRGYLGVSVLGQSRTWTRVDASGKAVREPAEE